MTPIGVGVVGLGFMGQTHVRAYQAAAADGLPCRLLAVCDSDPQKLTGRILAAGNLGGGPGPGSLFDPAAVAGHTDVEPLLADPAIGLVSICTYTDTHAALAERALAAGKHVMVEKPVAIGAAAVRRLAAAAERSGRLCMPGMCMRFWPGWDWLKARVDDRSLGPVRSATFQRLGSGPGWAAEFYRDPARSGGPMWDLHIHDADFVYWCFGRPRAVTTLGTPGRFMTAYTFDSGPSLVTAEAGWDLARGAGFRMRFLVTFDHATVEFDLSRTPAAAIHRDSGTEAVPVPALSAYDLEIRHLVRAAAGGGALRATIADAAAVAEILEAEGASLARGCTIDLPP